MNYIRKYSPRAYLFMYNTHWPIWSGGGGVGLWWGLVFVLCWFYSGLNCQITDIRSDLLDPMGPPRETLVFRTAYWHGLLPGLLGREGWESTWCFPLAELAWACLVQMILNLPPSHVFCLLLSLNMLAGTTFYLVTVLCMGTPTKFYTTYLRIGHCTMCTMSS